MRSIRGLSAGCGEERGFVRPPRKAAGTTLGGERAGDATLEVSGLHIEFVSRHGCVKAARGLSYSIPPGAALGLVGESGSGKSVSALAVLGLLPRRTARVTGGSITFGGRELVGLSDRDLRSVRGRQIALVFQDSLSSLNPVLTIGRQITEQLQAHGLATGRPARVRALELLDLVGIPDVSRRLAQYPHELSGGMRQRVAIAMALSCQPALLIADEPTTALDVTSQAQILELLEDLRIRLAMSLLLITHDLGIVARSTDRVAVMYAGRVVEQGPTADVLRDPRHPYTAGLLRSIPRLDRESQHRLVSIPGAPPDLGAVIGGCSFRPRCPIAIGRCVDSPPLGIVGEDRTAACWRPLPDQAHD